MTYISINNIHFNNTVFSIKIPLNKLVVITGPSGVGKSYIIKNTLYLEFKNLYFHTLPSNYYNNNDYILKKTFEKITNLYPIIFLNHESFFNIKNVSIGEFLDIYNDLSRLFLNKSKPYSYKNNDLMKSCYDNNKIKNIIINKFVKKKIKILTIFIKNSIINYKNLISFLHKNNIQ